MNLKSLSSNINWVTVLQIADEEYFDAIVELVKEVLHHKTSCQKDSEDDSFCEDVQDDSGTTRAA